MLKQIGVKSIVKTSKNKVYISNVDKRLDKKVNEISKEVSNFDAPIFSLVFEEDKNKYKFEANGLKYEEEKPFLERKNVLKDEIEKRYFGKNYDDNLRVQIASNLMDIQKVLSFYIDDVCYAMSNIYQNASNNYNSTTDFIGNDVVHFVNYGKLDSNKKQNVDALIMALKEYGALFGGLLKYDNVLPSDESADFFIDKKTNKKNYRVAINDTKFIYSLLRCLALVRNFSFHPDEKRNNFLYDVENKHLTNFAKNMFRKKIDKHKQSFFDNSQANDLRFLKSIYPNQTDLQLLKELYDFTTFKDYKTMGISIKKIREILVEKYFSNDTNVSVQRLSEIKPKINKYFDFIVYKYLDFHEPNVIGFKTRLYSVVGECKDKTLTGKERKQKIEEDRDNKFLKIYEDIANEINKSDFVKTKGTTYFDLIKNFWVKVDSKISTNTKDVQYKELRQKFIEETRNINVSDFAAFIYILTIFLSGKEINELLNYIINKCESTISLIYLGKEIAEKEGDQEKQDEYKTNNSYICLIKDFCKAAKTDVAFAKNFIRQQKLSALGERMSEKVTKNAIELLGSKDVNGAYALACPPKVNKFDRRKNVLKNFLRNNVVASRQFDYILRYVSVKKCRLIMNNDSVVNYVLDQIPESKLERYYEIGNKMGQNINRQNIVSHLRKLSFDALIENKNNPKYVEYLKALTGLYLNIAYLFIKNMVRTNALYSIALIANVRDLDFIESSTDNQKTEIFYRNLDSVFNFFNERKAVFGKKYRNKNGDAVNTEFIEGVENNVKTLKELATEVAKVSVYRAPDGNLIYKDIVKIYRNNIAHLTVVNRVADFIGNAQSTYKYKNDTPSYFDIFNFSIQALVFNAVERVGGIENTKIYKYIETIKKYGSASRDFIKIINSPFAYNLARYKRLTYQNIFEDGANIGTKGDKK